MIFAVGMEESSRVDWLEGSLGASPSSPVITSDSAGAVAFPRPRPLPRDAPPRAAFGGMFADAGVEYGRFLIVTALGIYREVSSRKW